LVAILAVKFLGELRGKETSRVWDYLSANNTKDSLMRVAGTAGPVSH
jgi:hypothetical protein